MTGSRCRHPPKVRRNLPCKACAQRRVDSFHFCQQFRCRHFAVIDDVLAVDFRFKSLGILTRAAAVGTVAFFYKRQDFVLQVLFEFGDVAFQIQPFKSRNNALVINLVDMPCVVAADFHLDLFFTQRAIRLTLAVFEIVPLGCRKIAEFLVGIDFRVSLIKVCLPAVRELTETDCALAKCLGGVKKQILFQDQIGAKPRAVLAHSHRVVGRIRHRPARTRLAAPRKQQPHKRRDIKRRADCGSARNAD